MYGPGMSYLTWGVKDQIDVKNRSVNAARSYLWRDAAFLLD